jgi:oxalate decarboxylase
MTTGSANPPDGLQPDLDSRNAATPTVSERGFPTAPVVPEQPGIGLPWLGLAADAYAPPGGVDADHPHLFHLQSAGANYLDGGSLQGAHGENWPIVVGQKAAVYLVRLEPGGVREPHWHPSAWELNFVMAGRTRWSFVGPNSTEDRFEAGAGDLIFAPQGHFHYFENASDTDDLYVLIAFNAETTEPKDDVGLLQSLSSIPTDVLGALFNVPSEVFDSFPRATHKATIIRKGERPA